MAHEPTLSFAFQRGHFVGILIHLRFHGSAAALLGTDEEWAKTIAAADQEGARYMVTWKAEWMDSQPMQNVVGQASAKE